MNNYTVAQILNTIAWCMTDQPIGRLRQHLGSKPCKEKMAAIYG